MPLKDQICRQMKHRGTAASVREYVPGRCRNSTPGGMIHGGTQSLKFCANSQYSRENRLGKLFFGYRPMMRVVDGLETLGYLESHKGQKYVGEWKDGKKGQTGADGSTIFEKCSIADSFKSAEIAGITDNFRHQMSRRLEVPKSLLRFSGTVKEMFGAGRRVWLEFTKNNYYSCAMDKAVKCGGKILADTVNSELWGECTKE